MSETEMPTVGHNAPPLVDIEDLKFKLRRDWAHLFVKLEDFEEAFYRWQNLHAVKDDSGNILRCVIADDDDQGKSGDFLSQINSWAKTIDGPGNDSIRAKVKEPVLQASRIIDSTFKSDLADRFRVLATGVHGAMEQFAKSKAAAARAAAEAERAEAFRIAAEKQREADELAKLAAKRNADPDTLDKAMEAEQAALDAQHEAALVPATAPKASDASRTYGSLGSVSSLKTTWIVEVENEALLPREFMMPNMALLEAKMKSSRVKNGPPKDPPTGVRYVAVEKLGNR
jgi:hypothetical protein